MIEFQPAQLIVYGVIFGAIIAFATFWIATRYAEWKIYGRDLNKAFDLDDENENNKSE